MAAKDERTEVYVTRFRDAESSGAGQELFSRLRRALGPYVSSHPVFRALRRWSSEEDLVQEVLLSLLDRDALERFQDRGPGSLRAYVKKHADGTLRDMLRRCTSQRRGGGVEVNEIDSRIPGVEPNPSSAVRHDDLLEECVANLPESQADAWHAHVVKGMGFDEIARESGCTPSAVRGRVFRAINRLIELELIRRPKGRDD